MVKQLQVVPVPIDGQNDEVDIGPIHGSKGAERFVQRSSEHRFAGRRLHSNVNLTERNLFHRQMFVVVIT